MNQHKIFKFCLSMTVFSSFGLLSSCAPVLVMGTATTLTTSAAEERGIGGVISDTEIKARIKLKWSEEKPALGDMIDVTVRQGRVLLTGVVNRPENKIDAIRLTWTIVGVQEVIDETTIGDQGSWGEYTSDAWISTKIKSKLLVDNDVRSLNYNIQTVNGIVYIMGIAQDQKELDQVIDYARHVSGVKKVNSYVRVKRQASALGSEEAHTIPSERTEDQKRASQPAAPLSSENHDIDVQPLNRPNQNSSFQ